MQISKMFQYSLITFILLMTWNCSKSQPVNRNSSEPFVIGDYRLISASLLLAIISVLYSCNNESLENTTWKYCGDNGGVSDVIVTINMLQLEMTLFLEKIQRWQL